LIIINKTAIYVSFTSILCAHTVFIRTFASLKVKRVAFQDNNRYGGMTTRPQRVVLRY